MADLVTMRVKDFCCIKEAEVALYDQGLVLVTGKNRDTEAAANNGAGKSTIGKALTWCLFGDTLDGDKHDKVIRYGTKEAKVEIELRIGKSLWVVTRARAAGKPLLFLEAVDGPQKTGEPWAGSPEEVQQKIFEIVGRDFRSFCNTTLFGQDDTARFFSATDSAMKETLHKILRSDIFRRCEKRLREVKVKELYDEIAELSRMVGELKARLGEYNVQAIQASFDEWAIRNEEKAAEELGRSQQLLKELKAFAVGYKRQELEAKETIDRLAAEVSDAEVDPAQIEKLQDEIETCEARFSELQELRSNIDSDLRTTENALSQLTDDKCPTCTAPLSSGSPATYLKKLHKDKVRDEARHVKVAQDLELVGAQAEAARKALRGLQETRRQRDVDLARLQGAETNIERLRAAHEAGERSLKDRAKEGLERVKTLRAEPNPYRDRLEAARARVGAFESDLHDRNKELEAKRLELAHYEFWVKGFGSRGLPSLLLDSVMPFITSRTNEYLLTLADGDLTVTFSTQRELKSKKGEMRDEITKECVIEGVPGATPSKGQRRKFEIATDLALVDLAATTEGTSSLLFMDEVLDGLDDEGEARVLRLLRDLRSRYSSLFVVTHEAAISEGFDRVLHITKKNKAATVEVIR